MQIDLKTGTLERDIPVQVSEKFIAAQPLAHGWLTNIGLSALRVVFAEVAGQVVLDVSVVNYQRDAQLKYESLQIPLVEFLANSG